MRVRRSISVTAFGSLLALGCCTVLFHACKQKPLDARLFLAASQGNVGTLEKRLAAGAEVNAKDPEGETPLMYAASEGQPESAILLLSREANIYAVSFNGETALGRAALFGHAETCRVLLEHGARVDEQMDQGGTPLMFASSVPVVNVLLSHGARVNARNDFGITALMGAASKDELISLRLSLGLGLSWS